MGLVHSLHEKKLPPVTLVLGGAASGKSLVAETLILNSGLKPVYLATSRIRDAEMQAKVDLHRTRRGTQWLTEHADVDLGAALSARNAAEAVLIDCATMWLTNVMLDEMDLAIAQSDLINAVSGCDATVVVVTNEVGHGIVPENALARRFREAQGRLNIALAAAADRVLLVTAGLSQVLK